MQQPQGMQPVAQERRALHENLPTMPRSVPMDRQDWRAKQQGGKRNHRRIDDSCRKGSLID